MKHKIYKERGSIQLYVLTASVLVSITLASIYLVLQTAYSATIVNNSREQAYYTALSGLQTVVNILTNPVEENELLEEKLRLSELLLVHTEVPQKIKFDFGGEIQEQMGKCEIESMYDTESRELTLTATAVKGERKSVLTAVIGERFSWGDLNDDFFNVMLASKDVDGNYLDDYVIDYRMLLEPNYTCFKVPDDVNCGVNNDIGAINVGFYFDNNLPQFFFIGDNATLSFNESIVSLQEPLYFVLESGADLYFTNNEGDLESAIDGFGEEFDWEVKAVMLDTMGDVSLINRSGFSQALMSVYLNDDNVLPVPTPEVDTEYDRDGNSVDRIDEYGNLIIGYEEDGSPKFGVPKEIDPNYDPDYKRKEDLLNNWNYNFSGYQMGGTGK